MIPEGNYIIEEKKHRIQKGNQLTEVAEQLKVKKKMW